MLFEMLCSLSMYHLPFGTWSTLYHILLISNANSRNDIRYCAEWQSHLYCSRLSIAISSSLRYTLCRLHCFPIFTLTVYLLIDGTLEYVFLSRKIWLSNNQLFTVWEIIVYNLNIKSGCWRLLILIYHPISPKLNILYTSIYIVLLCT